MPIDLTGIRNENEFYSDHYLTTVFEGDIKETIEQWNELKEGGGKAPHQEFAALATPYMRAATEYRDTRDPDERVQIFREFTYDLLKALDYSRTLQQPILADGTWLPALHRAARSDGTDHLWVIEALAPAGEDFVTDPLALSFASQLGPDEIGGLPEPFSGTYEEALTAGIFGPDQPPRFVLILSMAQAVLIDRNKWGESRLLRFDFTEIFSRKESATMQAVTALLHHECLAPDTGTPLVDTIDEESHRHAHGVSKDLKYALREAIELLGNEAAEQIVARRKAAGETAYQTRDGMAALDARQLSLESLRYMYRLLFLFYIEARPDLGFAPMKSDAYRKGYSLESLRELEMIPLTSDEEKDGHYLHESLSLLFNLIYEGTPYSDLKSDDEFGRDFDMRPVRTHLFDPDSTPMLSKVRFRNETLQRIIQLMSLSREGQGRRGRISYAQLGINQLGAVYEALLSYSGFFAQTDLYEVKKAGEPNPDPLEAAYFVPKSDIDKYEQDEIVYDGNDPRIYSKGTFIYRLAGRDRENSASYYTPEILTRCLVKYALKELLKDKTADDILKLTVCEPAMGSAAFLVEAVNQLSDSYLAKKQEELGERIPHDRFAYERQKVRAYITDRNTFGVDLNPIAMELGQVSLWLNCIHEGDFIPWFGDQLFAGNSLISARREVYPVSRIGKRTEADDRWFKHAPRAVKSDAPRKDDEVYHFLLPDPSMADYKRAIVEPLAPDKFEKLKDWRKEFCKPLDSDDIAQVKRLSQVIDELLAENAKALAKERQENTDPLTVWGQPEEDGKATDFKAKNRRLEGMRGEGARDAVPFQRLKIAMDYWCSLWFWPLEHADLLPSRDEYLLDMTLILEGNVLSSGADMFQRESLLSDADPNKVDLFDNQKSYGQVDIQTLTAKSPRLRVVDEIALRNRFFHWSVELGDIIAEKDGFDVILGNPPWIRIHWSETDTISEKYPEIAIRSLKKAEKQALLSRVTEEAQLVQQFLLSYYSFSAAQEFLGSMQNYPLNGGQKVNLYKCFIELAFKLCTSTGGIGLLHPEGVYDSPDGKSLREQIYRRLELHARFSNELKLFSDIGNRNNFGINIYRGQDSIRESFLHICNLFHPKTLDESLMHDGIGVVPGIKSSDNKWDLSGHSDRIITVTPEKLRLLNIFFEGANDDMIGGRLPIVHSEQTMNVMRKVSIGPRLASDPTKWATTREWNEGDRQDDGILSRDVHRPETVEDLIFSGPHIYHCTPFYQTPTKGSSTHRAYIGVSAVDVDPNYLPRTIYRVNRNATSYSSKLPKWEGAELFKKYRYAHRRRVGIAGERTLIPAILPKGAGSLGGVANMAFRELRDVALCCGICSTTIADFIIRCTGRTDIFPSDIQRIPSLADTNPIAEEIVARAVRLNSMTSHFSEFWQKTFSPNWTSYSFSQEVSGADSWALCEEAWTRASPVKTDFARRLSLLEMDVLFALSLGITFDELREILITQFPVLVDNERSLLFDANGRAVPVSSTVQGEASLNLLELSNHLLREAGFQTDQEYESSGDFAHDVIRKRISLPKKLRAFFGGQESVLGSDIFGSVKVERTGAEQYLLGIKYTFPGSEPVSQRVYPTPWREVDRVHDYQRAWDYFSPKYASKAAA